MTPLPVSGHFRLASDCSAHGYTAAPPPCTRSNSHPMDASSPPRLGDLFRFTTVRAATSSESMSQLKPHSCLTTLSPGRAVTNTCLLYLPARSSVSTPPLAQRFLNGPFTAANTIALHWQAMAHSSQPLLTHRSRSGIVRQANRLCHRAYNCSRLHGHLSKLQHYHQRWQQNHTWQSP